MVRFIPAAMAALCLAMPAHAQIYQWKDADGKVHFTDKPPANQKTRTIDIKTPPTGSGSQDRAPAPAATAQERQKKMIQVLDEDRKAKQEARAKQEEEDQKQVQRCGHLRDAQRSYARGGRVYTLNEDGERVYKTDEEISDDRERIDQELKECH